MAIIMHEERKRTVGVESSMIISSSCDVFVNFRDFKVVEKCSHYEYVNWGFKRTFFFPVFLFVGVRSGVVGCGTALPAGRARV